MDLVAQQSRLTGQLQIAKEQANIHIDLRPLKNIESVNGEGSNLARDNLLQSETAALLHSIDPRELARKGWLSDERGRVRDKDGNEIFKVGFINAIEKLLSV